MHNPARLAAFLRDYMNQHDITTERAMAAQAGVSQGTINKILNQKSVRARTVDAIIDNLKLDKRKVYLATGMIPPIEKKKSDGTFTREYLLDVICHELADLSPEHQQEVIRVIREFAVRKR